MFSLLRMLAKFSVLFIFVTTSLLVFADAESQSTIINPMRLSYINGSVSFWRYGSDGWVEARVNTPLISGDALYTGKNSELELQAEGRAYIRIDDSTQLSLVNQTADFLQLKVTSGRVSLDLRSLPLSGYTIEVDTPSAVLTIDHTGYYRIDIDNDLHLITRRGGRAVMTPLGGAATAILPSEEVVVHQVANLAQAETYAAPQLDAWDQWNYDRSNYLADAVSERYLSAGISGASDLDYYGSWRVSEEYGPVWLPDGVSSDWAPYSVGRWVWDPNYQWTWIDDAPWGWAPFHYGRWVYYGGYWAWAPGPVSLQRPRYAPALVAFFSVKPNTIVGIGGPSLCWIALGWGEPIVPWWGRNGFIGRPWWGGWGGPRVVNNLIVKKSVNINLNHIIYSNSLVPNALIATSHEQFGREHVHEGSVHPRIHDIESAPLHGPIPVKPSAIHLVADAHQAEPPPEQVLARPVTAIRRPQDIKLPWRVDGKPSSINAEQYYVTAPNPAATSLRRPMIGQDTGPERERPVAPQPFQVLRPKFEAPLPIVLTEDQNVTDKLQTKPNRSLSSKSIPISNGQEKASPILEQSTISTGQYQQTDRMDQAITPVPLKRIEPRSSNTPHELQGDNSPSAASRTNRSQERQPDSLQKIEAIPQLSPNPSDKLKPARDIQGVIQPAPVLGHGTQTIEHVNVPSLKPQGIQKELPGRPANSTFHRVNQPKSEKESQNH